MKGPDESARPGLGADLVVFKCEACGDTFPAHREKHPVCPTCNSPKVHEAHEPLL